MKIECLLHQVPNPNPVIATSQIPRLVSVPITLGYNLIQINLGPQHPSTHGVLRIIAFVECETIKSLEPELGLLHRGSEKLIEYRC